MRICLAEEITSEVIAAESRQSLKSTLRRAANRLGFDHFALSIEGRPGREGQDDLLLHDYPDEWAKVYLAFDLAGRDPVRRACDKSPIGFCWDELGSLIPLTRGDRQMLAIGQECGLGDGYTVPRHLPGDARGTCSFVVRPQAELPKPQLMVAEIVGAAAIVSALRVSGFAQNQPRPVLSDRQRECLVWSARGKTAEETGMILGISTETVNQHLKMARERYDVCCRQSLIVNALFDGLIGFSDVMRWHSGH